MAKKIKAAAAAALQITAEAVSQLAPETMTREEATTKRRGVFELCEWTAATIMSYTGRTEKRGDEDVPALILRFKIRCSNQLLDQLSPTLRHTLYAAPEGQVTLPGVEGTTPILRSNDITCVEISQKFEGWTLHVDYGVDEDDPIVCGGVKVDAFEVEPSNGGLVDLYLRTGTSDVKPHDAGILWSKNHQEVWIMLLAPKPTLEAIDGTVGHPGLAATDERDAGDLFAEQHGGESGDGDQGDESATERDFDDLQDREQETAEA